LRRSRIRKVLGQLQRSLGCVTLPSLRFDALVSERASDCNAENQGNWRHEQVCTFGRLLASLLTAD
jgi:hypothetical protein